MFWNLGVWGPLKALLGQQIRFTQGLLDTPIPYFHLGSKSREPMFPYRSIWYINLRKWLVCTVLANPITYEVFCCVCVCVCLCLHIPIYNLVYMCMYYQAQPTTYLWCSAWPAWALAPQTAAIRSPRRRWGTSEPPASAFLACLLWEEAAVSGMLHLSSVWVAKCAAKRVFV